ncbi:MAG: TolC family protein [Nitrospinota bacterium]|nr:TolC family protein [Nitrospinota bacterium]
MAVKYLAAIMAIVFAIAGSAASQAREIPRTLTLDQCLAIAMEKNSGVNIALREREMAELSRTEAMGKALPDLDLRASYTRAGKNPEVEFFGTKFKLAPDEAYQAQATLTQYLYSGAVSSGYRASGLLLQAAAGMESARRMDVASQVKTGFYAILFTREVIKTEQAAVNQLQSHIKDSQDRQAVGLNTRYDTMRLETRLAEERHRLLEAENLHARAQLDLLALMGLDPMTPVSFVGSLETTIKPFGLGLEQAVAASWERRPEVAAARAKLEATREIANAVAREQYPTVSAFGNYQVANNVGIGDSDQLFDQWNVGLRLEMNIFDGRERSSRRKKRLVEVEMETIRLAELQRNVTIEVKAAFDELARAREFHRSQEKNVQYAEETYRIASVNRQEGVMTQLELLDAQMALTQAGITYQKSLFEYATAMARLRRAIGEDTTLGDEGTANRQEEEGKE